MTFNIQKANNITYIEFDSPDFVIQNERDILDMIVACGENETNSIIIHERNLSPDFFDLKTGLAGTLFQKLANYRMKGAGVIGLGNIKSERFKELVYECNKGNLFRFFENREAAEKWLTD